MSRSYRKSPCFAWTTSRSEKIDKQLWHRRYRRVCKHAIASEGISLELLPHVREHSDPWSMSKDGRGWWIPQESDSDWIKGIYKQNMRK